MYNISLNEGDLIPIYTNYKTNIQFEGNAILLEKIEDGDTFFLENESTNSNPEMNKEGDAIKTYRNTILNEVFKQDHLPRDISAVKIKLLSLKSHKNDEYNNMYDYLEKYRDSISKTDIIKNIQLRETKLKKLFAEVPLDYIVRYFQQYKLSTHKTLRELRPSVFKYELWKVRILYDPYGNFINRVVNRKIRVIVKNKCNPKNLSDYITYNAERLTMSKGRKKVI